MSKRWASFMPIQASKKVIVLLQSVLKRAEMEHLFGEALVPTEEVVEIKKNGVKRKRSVNSFQVMCVSAYGNE